MSEGECALSELAHLVSIPAGCLPIYVMTDARVCLLVSMSEYAARVATVRDIIDQS